jgi:bacteriocin-like protein
MKKIMSKTPMHNSEAMSNHMHELANQANELSTDELDAVSGGFEYTERTHGAPKQEAVFPTETIKLSYGAIEWTYTK